MSQRARTELEEILNMKEFRGQEAQSPPWWSKWVERILRRLPGGSIRWIAGLLELILYLIAISGIIFICIFIAKRLRRSPYSTTSRDIPRESWRHMDPGAAQAKAHEHFQKGEYRQAIRYLHLSLLLYLDKAGSLTYDAGKTNGEYLREIRSSIEDKAEHFAFLTAFFERKWYGMEKSNAEDFQQCKETFTELVMGL